MVAAPDLEDVVHFFQEQELELDGGGEAAVLHLAEVAMETTRGRLLGTAAMVLIDVSWELADCFIRAHSLRSTQNFELFVGAVALGFGGMLHPNEFLALRRRDLVFPHDSMMWDSDFLYVFTRNPKTARFAKRQHVRVDDRSLVQLLFCIFGRLGLDERSFPASTAVFRRQWNAVLDKLEIPRRQSDRGATPGTLRGSGATREYIQGSDISRIQWRGRWCRLRTLEYYIEEVAAQLFLFNLTPGARQTISVLEQHLCRAGSRLFSLVVLAEQAVRSGGAWLSFVVQLSSWQYIDGRKALYFCRWLELA